MMIEKEMYEFFVEEWQNEYGPRPSEYVPDINSEEFRIWLDSNKTL